MEKMMIYPYSRAYEPYVRNKGILGEYTISALVSPRGWGYEGNIVADGQGEEYMVSADFSEQLDACTSVWFVEDGRLKMPQGLLREKLLKAVDQGKKILYTRYDDENYEEMKKLIPAELYIEEKMELQTILNLLPDRTYDIDTPIVVVAGTGQDTDKLAIQLILKQKFQEKGYATTVISSRRDGDWDGVYSMPSFVFDCSVGETEKIIKLNHYVKQIESKDRPDLFIVGVPGAILPFDGIDHNEFGILAYEMSFAVPCDVAVLCMTYSSQFKGDYGKLAKDMENRFGFNIAGIHVAAMVPDPQDFYEERKMIYVSIDQKVVEKKVSEINEDTVWNILNPQGAERAVLRLIDILSK